MSRGPSMFGRGASEDREELKKVKDDLKKAKEANKKLEDDLNKAKEANKKLEDDLNKAKEANKKLEDDLKKAKETGTRSGLLTREQFMVLTEEQKKEFRNLAIEIQDRMKSILSQVETNDGINKILLG